MGMFGWIMFLKSPNGRRVNLTINLNLSGGELVSAAFDSPTLHPLHIALLDWFGL